MKVAMGKNRVFFNPLLCRKSAKVRSLILKKRKKSGETLPEFDESMKAHFMLMIECGAAFGR